MSGIKMIVVGWVWLLPFFQKAVAQMPIEKEPHHKVVFENEQMRVIDLVVPPRDTTLVHSHNAGSVVIFLTASSFAIQNPNQAPVVTKVKIGDAVYREYDEKPVAHTVWSADSSVFHCLVVEVKSKAKR